jgi:bifunctional non-homologous end joining protein LigD
MSLRERTRPGLGIIEPCLPSPAKAPPPGPGWIHEIKHDGFRILARRDNAGVRLITRAGNDFSSRFPFIATAVAKLPVRSCLIDGEAIVCDEHGLAVFELIRRHGHSPVPCYARSTCLSLMVAICGVSQSRNASGCPPSYSRGRV